MKKNNGNFTKKDLEQAIAPVKKELKVLKREVQLWKIESKNTRVEVSMLEMRVRRLDEDILLLKDDFNDRFQHLSDKFLTLLDPAMGELKAIREELAAHGIGHDRIQDNLEDHEFRIKKLEKPATFPHQ